MELKNKKVVLGVAGGIAAYKACDLARRLTDQGADVHVILTTSAQEFITPLTFQSLTGNAVHTDLFSLTEESEMSHIHLADSADLIIVAPTTADLIAKIAVGMANDLLTTVLLVTRSPVFLAPSMNVNMWEKEVVQKNLRTLQDRGYHIVEPEEGFLACGWEGKGRLAESEAILKAVRNLSASTAKKKSPAGSKGLAGFASLAGKKILINAGPTREYLDPVRFISNPSSGKMGFALATEAAARGAKVTLVSGPVSLPTPAGVTRIDVSSAEDMYRACKKTFPDQDVFIATAAVGDYEPERVEKTKLKKSAQSLSLKLNPTVDVLKALAAARKKGQLIVGFAAETDQVLKNAQKKLREKNLDLVVANEISAKNPGFGAEETRVVLVPKNGPPQNLHRLPKEKVAVLIMNWIWEAFRPSPGAG